MSYLVTFLEGVITFISPCLLPMLPIYLSYFAAGTQGPGSTRATAKNALGFILGFTVTFLLLGTLAGSVGMLLYRWQFAVNLICGAVVVFWGKWAIPSALATAFTRMWTAIRTSACSRAA